MVFKIKNTSERSKKLQDIVSGLEVTYAGKYKYDSPGYFYINESGDISIVYFWDNIEPLKTVELHVTLDLQFTADFEYILLNVNQYTDDALFEKNNLIASVFALDKKQDMEHFIKNMNRVAKVMMNLSQEEQIELKDWIQDVLLKKRKNVNKKLEEFEKRI